MVHQKKKKITKIGDEKKHKIGWNYCHQHLKTHQFLQITKIFTKIGDNFSENPIENSNHQNFHQN